MRGGEECVVRRRLAVQHALGARHAPRLVGDAAERDARLGDAAVLDPQRRRDRDQREGVGQPVAQLEIGVVLGEVLGRQVDGRDQFAAAAGCCRATARRRAGGDSRRRGSCGRRPAPSPAPPHSSAASATHMSDGWVAMQAVARAEDRVDAVDAADRAAARSRLALVAGCRGVVEIIAARALVEVAAVGRRVAQLRAGAGEDRRGRAADSAARRADPRRCRRWWPARRGAGRRLRSSSISCSGSRLMSTTAPAARHSPSSDRRGWCRRRGSARAPRRRRRTASATSLRRGYKSKRFISPLPAPSTSITASAMLV